MSEILAGAALVAGVVGGIQSADKAGAAEQEAKTQLQASQKAEQDLLNTENQQQQQEQATNTLISERDAQENGANKPAFTGNNTIFTGPQGIPNNPIPANSLLGQ